jgi:hypothetical protein
MALRHISILVKDKDVDKFKVIFGIIQKKQSEEQLPSPKIGKLGKDYLIALKFKEDFYRTAVETLTYNDMKILLPDDQTQEMIDQIREKRMQIAINSSIIVDDSPIRSRVSAEAVDEMVDLGNYGSIISVSKNINADQEVVERALNNISISINRAIDIAVLEAKSDKALIKSSIKKLIHIASDNKIKSLNKLDLLKRAGLEAIELCIDDWDTVKELINISNNNQLHNLINIKAAVKFYDVVLSNRTKYKLEIEAATKKLNVRWLIIALDVVENNITDEEKSKLESLIEFIRKKR